MGFAIGEGVVCAGIFMQRQQWDNDLDTNKTTFVHVELLQNLGHTRLLHMSKYVGMSKFLYKRSIFKSLNKSSKPTLLLQLRSQTHKGFH